MKYYEIVVKVGHVGKRKYIEIPRYIKASSIKEAVLIAKHMPGVKGSNGIIKNVILSVEEITLKEFERAVKEDANKDYFEFRDKTGYEVLETVIPEYYKKKGFKKGSNAKDEKYKDGKDKFKKRFKAVSNELNPKHKNKHYDDYDMGDV